MTNYDDLLNNTPKQYDPPQLSKEEYADKKKSERETVFELSDKTAMEITADGGKFRSFLDLQARLDRYSAVNALLVYAQNPNASRLGDFNYWKQKNCSVAPGQTAISILEPHAYTKEDGTPGTGYNVKKVFDVSQVDTRRLREKPAPQYTERQLLGALISKAPMTITGVDELPDGAGVMTDPETGIISVLRGMGFQDTFQSVAQELGYYEADADAAKIPVNPTFVGYCTSYILCQKYGVDTQAFNFSLAPDVFHKLSEQGIKQELTIIRDAVENISGRMARQLEAQQKAAKSQEAR